MSLIDRIVEHLKDLPEAAQQEVLELVEFLAQKRAQSSSDSEERDWSELSLGQAMQGMEDEESPYTLADLKERFGLRSFRGALGDVTLEELLADRHEGHRF